MGVGSILSYVTGLAHHLPTPPASEGICLGPVFSSHPKQQIKKLKWTSEILLQVCDFQGAIISPQPKAKGLKGSL